MLPARCRLLLRGVPVGDLLGEVGQTWSASLLKDPLGEEDLGER